jgi:D-alanyl-D-alanine carboxypeptidase (penicillin-binding protein 5/6)
MKQIITSTLLILCAHAQASITGNDHLHQFKEIDPLPNLHVTGYASINISSQTLLAEHNSHERMPPASLTKLMTLLIAYDYLDKGLIHLKEKVHISQKAWRVEGSRMFLEPGSYESVEQLLRGISIVSGNDASIAMAEHIAGNEKNFVEIMNRKAVEIGLKDTHFDNSTGLPSATHYSTPYDMSLLGMHLIQKHPSILEHTSEKSMTYGKISQDNRNRLLWKDNSIFGLKTGHTRDAGYCLVASANRDNQLIVATVFGAKSEPVRDAAVTKLLNHAQNRFKNIEISSDRKLEQVKTWYGKKPHIQAKLSNPIKLSLPADRRHQIKASINLNDPLKAPITKGAIIGKYELYYEDSPIGKTDIIANETLDSKHAIWQAFEWISLSLTQWQKSK